jgi:chorismate mutase
MDALSTIRKQLDAIDKQVMSLLDARMKLSKEVGLIKQGVGIEARDREEQILAKAKQFEMAPQIQEVYEAIFKISKGLQR